MSCRLHKKNQVLQTAGKRGVDWNVRLCTHHDDSCHFKHVEKFDVIDDFLQAWQRFVSQPENVCATCELSSQRTPQNEH